MNLTPHAKTATTRLPKSTQAVLEALQQLNHATAPQVMDWINRAAGEKGDKKVSLTSVYRALNYWVAESKIKPLNFNDGQVRYELNNHQMHHHHLVCTRCERIQMLDSCPFEGQLAQLEGQFTIFYHNFEVFGLCNTCVAVSLENRRK